MVIRYPRRLLKRTLAEIQKGLGLTEKELLDMLGVQKTTFNNWLNGKNKIVRIKLGYVQKVFHLQSAFFLGRKTLGGRILRKWLRKDHLVFGKTPLDCLKNGEYEKVQHSFAVIDGASCA